MKIKLVLFFVLTISLAVHFPSGDFEPVYADTGDAWCDITTICNTDWENRMEIVIDHTEVSDSDTADFTNFPVMVHISGSTFTNSTHGFDAGADTLNDIRFTNSTGTGLLDYEIVKYDKTDNEMVAYVRVPTLDYNDDTTIYMYYDNAGSPTDEQDVSGTWNSNFEMVHHMNEASSHIIDSTSNNHDSNTIDVGMTYGQTGKFGDAIDFNGNSHFEIPDSAGLEMGSDFTLQVWIKNNISSGSYPVILNKLSGEPYLMFIWSGANPNNCAGDVQWGMNVRVNTPGTVNCTSATDVTDNNWYMITARYDNSNLQMWVNGVQDGTTADSGSTITSSGKLIIGAYDTVNALPYDGLMQSMQLSQNARSDGWIETSYANENTPNTFATLTVEEQAGGDPTYVVDLLDVYESESTTLGSGNAVCLDIDLEIADECEGHLIVGHTYRFEIEVDETGGNAGSPTTIDIDASIGDYDVFGNLVTAQMIDSGCSTNTNWSESIVSSDARASSGTTCEINSSSAEWWIIIRIDSAAGSGAQPTATFTIDDGSVSDVSTTTTFTVDN
jgi:hypothetical protein